MTPCDDGSLISPNQIFNFKCLLKQIESNSLTDPVCSIDLIASKEMSLNDKKSALFAKATNAKLDTIQPAKVVKPMTGSTPVLPPSSNTNRVPLSSSSSNNTTTATSIGYLPSITPDQKAKKLAEAKEFRDQAAKLLETSMFNWNPDYLAAAPLYDRASAIYKGIGDLELAREMMVQAAVTHKNANCLTASALAYTKASPIAESGAF